MSQTDLLSLSYDKALDNSSIPSSYDVLTSSFFRRSNDAASRPQLPDTVQVRVRAGHQNFGKAWFKDIGVFVKFGGEDRVRLEEAQSMQAVWRAFNGECMLIPELFGWRRTENVNYIYMSYIDGQTLEQSWPALYEEEKLAMAEQLRSFLDCLRTKILPSAQQLIGSVSNTRVQDISFDPARGLPYSHDHSGPFSCVKDFNDMLQFLCAPFKPLSERSWDPFRDMLPDDCAIRFTHGDLHSHNIMISGEQGSRRIAAIVDWAASGWYPEYWEYCRAWTGLAHLDEEWVSRVARPYPDEAEVVSFYWNGNPP